jgi:hypothetical protein
MLQQLSLKLVGEPWGKSSVQDWKDSMKVALVFPWQSVHSSTLSLAMVYHNSVHGSDEELNK